MGEGSAIDKVKSRYGFLYYVLLTAVVATIIVIGIVIARMIRAKKKVRDVIGYFSVLGMVKENVVGSRGE